MPEPRNPRPHLLLPESSETSTRYRASNAFGRNHQVPALNRTRHAAVLRDAIARIAGELPAVIARQEAEGWEEGFGLRVNFTGFQNVDFAVESLDLKSVGIEVLNAKETPDGVTATVWMPPQGLAKLESKLFDYLNERRDSRGRPLDSQKLIDAIRDIRAALLEDLWTDPRPIPAPEANFTFEAWISTPKTPVTAAQRRNNAVRVTPENRIERFRHAAEAAGLEVGTRVLRFPERAVLMLRGSIARLRQSTHLLGQVAELRYAPQPAEFFMNLEPAEQPAWIDELTGRTEFPAPELDVPYVCILDTGCTRAHPLIAQSLAEADLHTIDPAWGTNDGNGHGTAQAGLAVWGDLPSHLAGMEQVKISHRLECVKLLPQDNVNPQEHLGPLTAQAVSRPEIQAPDRRRVFSMAVTSDATLMDGRPTAWSAEVDALTSDSAGDGDAPRLLIVSGGNVQNLIPGGYFNANTLSSIEDPANAWNAIAVGALTNKIDITEADTEAYDPVASQGGLSPYSSTSQLWRPDAPFKPDVVFEGGNVGSDGSICSRFDSLDLLTAHHRPRERLFSTTWGTSAATALASRFAAQVMASYPYFWPETVRAMMVHSAEWTHEMLGQLPGATREQTEVRLRHCGWGEPDLATALHSGADSLTLIAQSSLQPYARQEQGNITAGDMNLHNLPWPQDVLEGLLDIGVELRITLSYFVEPNPGERGRSDRFRYASHGLRFAVKRPTESVGQFQQRINALSRDEDFGLEPTDGADPRWLLGARRRFRGSLHHDRLRCTAADLAARSHIAVFPVGGWWKTRDALGRFNQRARYSLVATIHAPGLPVDVDLYTPVQQALQAAVAVPVAI